MLHTGRFSYTRGHVVCDFYLNVLCIDLVMATGRNM
jgi:hypothetical protein